MGLGAPEPQLSLVRTTYGGLGGSAIFICMINLIAMSFKLLYLMDEVSDPAISVLAEGHQ